MRVRDSEQNKKKKKLEFNSTNLSNLFWQDKKTTAMKDIKN